MPEELDDNGPAEVGESRQVREPLCPARKKAVGEENIGSLCAVGLVIEPGLLRLLARCLLHDGASVA